MGEAGEVRLGGQGLPVGVPLPVGPDREAGEELAGRDHAPDLERQVVEEEHVDPGPGRVPRADRVPPVSLVLVDRPPVSVVQEVQIGSFPTGALEEVVLHQVGGEEGRPPRIQRLEDGLGVVVPVQVDHDDPQVVPDGAQEGLRPHRPVLLLA